MEFKHMELIPDLRMPPFSRIQWASKEIKDKWEKRFYDAQRFYFRMEKITVERGLRACTTEHFESSNYNERSFELAERGLYFLPIQKVGLYHGFSSYHPPALEGQPYTYYGSIARNIKDAKAFADHSVTDPADHRQLGRLLGYPECCLDNFDEVWTRDGYTDPNWQKLSKTDPKYIKKNEGNFVRLSEETPWEINSFLRNYNIGPIFHIQCGHDCQRSLEYARKWFEIADEIEPEISDDIKKLLQMPMEWDCYKGIAYLRTPLYKCIFNSCRSTERFVIQREGIYYPEEAPKGLEFPWNEYYKINRKKRVK